MEKLIAVVDDEDDIRELVSINLKKAGFKTKEYSDADSLIKSLSKSAPDLIILDIMMPGTDGIETLKILKKDDRYSMIPIILLTAKSDEPEKVVGLEIGADDYVTKPFSPRELAARVKAVLRRKSKTEENSEIVELGPVSIDMDKHEVTVRGKKVELTATEFNILHILALKKERVLSREQILDNLWGSEKTVVDRTIDVHIKHLRTKLGAAGKMIKNIRGVGYKIE
ncbi:MAG: response regulator transcription factor [Candidatus Goldiibacteriota bacterium]|jgi:two-component system phosphate regulon response regulator PhoB/two-component system alkaline phosphatase synthesis response regulator PhoP